MRGSYVTKTIRFFSILLPLGVALSAAGAEPIYFLLQGLDSFIVPMTDSTNVAIARNFVRNGYGSGQPYSEAFPDMLIVAGRDGLNRNYSDPSMPEWSWHVETFYAFAGAVADTATATFLEVRYDWRSSPPVHVPMAFPLYQFTRELGPTPLFVNVRANGGNLEFYWSTPGTNRMYTLQQNRGFAANDWVSVPGCSWPVATNHVTVAMTNVVGLNFRVSAN